MTDAWSRVPGVVQVCTACGLEQPLTADRCECGEEFPSDPFGPTRYRGPASRGAGYVRGGPPGKPPPGPLWAWLPVLVVVTELLRLRFPNWPIEKGQPFADRDWYQWYWAHFAATFVFGLPVLAAYFVAWWWVNRPDGRRRR